MRMLVACMVCCLTLAYADETEVQDEVAVEETTVQEEVAEGSAPVDSLRLMKAKDCGCSKGKKK